MDKIPDHSLLLFRRWTQATLLFVFLVICAGAIVRATGSGMGCPDWPKCFGSWIPPTDISQLPSDYKEKYGTHGVVVEEFNVYKTWTEYVNRLFGAILGIISFITFLLSFRLRKKLPSVLWSSLLTLLLIGFEGWLGKTVVDSNLAPLRISLHMVVALIIMTICIYTIQQVADVTVKDERAKKMTLWIGGLLLLTIIQVVLGIRIREQVDTFTLSPIPIPKSDWVEMLNAYFPIHRSFSILVLGANMWVFYRLFPTTLKKTATAVLLLVIAGALTGMIMNYADFPGFSQPTHLVLAALLFGAQSVLLVRVYRS